MSWAGEPAFNAAVRSAEHSAFLTPPDCHFTAAGAWKLYSPLAWEDGSRAPRTSRHSNALLAGHRGSGTHLLALRVPTRTALKVIN